VVHGIDSYDEMRRLLTLIGANTDPYSLHEYIYTSRISPNEIPTRSLKFP
jgi:hypothetical protein